ncbi:MAG: molybdopterin-synthase adenylyltransferase MoeB [Deltaproteobacteria bacterium]|nr:molybdopterin-synthase adenylyltransferase MoeB [Deltaproteobacteria bacterium]
MNSGARDPAGDDRAARERIREIGIDEARAIVAGGGAWLDVREREEVVAGAIADAVWIARGLLELNADRSLPDKTRPVVVYCAAGRRSLLAALTLRELGYERVYSLAGGLDAWKRAGQPVVSLAGGDPVFAPRYHRHLLIDEIGERGQRALSASRVLLIGLGGLGSPAALYLCAAGVGHLGLVDDDIVDESNLQRQVIHDTTTVGLKKVESARLALRRLNPLVEVTAHAERFDETNAMRLLSQYDLVVDGCDNFTTRYLVNDACVLAGKPNFYGSVFRFDGQVSVFCAPGGPCYRCLHPEPPPLGASPACAEVGVLGVLPGIIGTLQAAEVIKWIVGAKESLVGRLLVVDALATVFRTIGIERSPTCPACGDAPTIRDLRATNAAACGAR